ncbi:hypothetical protein ACJX0J_032347, partial [Zea mays]
SRKIEHAPYHFIKRQHIMQWHALLKKALMADSEGMGYIYGEKIDLHLNLSDLHNVHAKRFHRLELRMRVLLHLHL